MKPPTPRPSRGLSLLLILLLALVADSAGVPASAEAAQARQRSLRELSGRVQDELRSMAHRSAGFNAAALVPRAARRIHGILAEGSAGEGGGFDAEARAVAREALRSGAATIFGEAKAGNEGGHQHQPRHLQLSDGRAQFYLFLVVLVVMAVGNVVNPENMPVFSGPQYARGIRGREFGPISPCNQIPLSYSETFGYLPILAGLFEDDLGDFSDVTDWLLDFLGLDETLRKAGRIEVGDGCYDAGEACGLTSECCTGDVSSGDLVSCRVLDEGGERQCVKKDADNAGADFVWEPFCLLWSEDEDSNGIDTLAFKPHYPWPPVEFVPGLPSVLPFCVPTVDKDGVKVKGCRLCDYHRGFPVGEVAVGPVPFKVTAKFDGIAVSWARRGGKLAFDPDGYEPAIWDGFRNVLLPRAGGVNFWMGLQFEVIPLPLWEWGRATCETDSSLMEEAQKSGVNFLKVTLKMDLFVSIGSDDDGGDGSALADQLGKNIAGGHEGGANPSESRRELQKGDDPCVIVTAAAEINIPLLGKLSFGDIAGGYCTYSADDNGERCTPSGAFLNVNQEFKIEGGAGGLLSTFLEGMTGDIGMEPRKAGNSLAVFLNDGDFEAVVLRLEAPVISLFGIALPGAGRPIIHFQYVKGSEVERRRRSILRTRVPGGAWLPNCSNLASEEICDNDNDAHWADFGDQSEALQTQICRNILINPHSNGDKLMYYNRVLAAELKDPRSESDNYLIRPPDYSAFQTPARYDFSNDPDANVVIVHMGLADFGNFIIALREISLSLILSDAVEPGIDQGDRYAAFSAYESMSETAKSLWMPPSGWHFPSLEEYLDHLPEDSSDFTDMEIEDANRWNDNVERSRNDGLQAYVRIFCKIAVLFFIDISLGFIMMNYADDRDPHKWRAAAQFETSVLGLLYSVSVSTVIDFDRRRHLHLEEQDYHRALATSGLEGADYDVSFDVECAPGSFCEAVVEFFEDVGEAVWYGLQRIGEFFVSDIREIASEAIAMVGEWGRAFVGAIEDFAEGIRDLFLDGAVGDVLNSERVQAFNEDAKKVVEIWSDGRFTLEDITAVGKLILDGIQVAFDFIVAGVKDIVNAIGDFFKNAGQAIKKCFTGAKWDEARHSGWRNLGECEARCDSEGKSRGLPSTVDHVKENCWCKDEFGCKVKTPQIRRCEKKKLGWDFWNGCKTSCGGWRDVPVKVNKGGKWRYPRFEGRRFDEACRQERIAKLAEVEKKHGKMTETGQIVDSNFQSNFNGLSNFSEQRRRQRRLEGGRAAKVNSVTFRGIQASSGGVYLDNVAARGHYDGSRLRANSTSMDDVQRDLTLDGLDFSSYGNPGANARRLEGDGDILLQFQRSAAGVFLEEQRLDDQDFMSRQPAILPPIIQLTGSSGTEVDPVELTCSGSLANAWSLKLNSAEPKVMRRRRTKEVGHIGTFETVVEFPAEARIRQMILTGAIPITISRGGPSGWEEDVFGDARSLLGTTGVGKFMDMEPQDSPDIFERRKTAQRRGYFYGSSTTRSLATSPVSAHPSSQPSTSPSHTGVPSSRPSENPSVRPSLMPSESHHPSTSPTATGAPSSSSQPSNHPSVSSVPSSQPSTSPTSPVDPNDYAWEVDVVTAAPLCDRLQWTFVVTATDRTGTSNRIELHAFVLYGTIDVNGPQNIQTRCDTSSIDVEDLEYDYELKDISGYETFMPSLSTDNCPSPYVHLNLLHKEDIVTNLGQPCTTDYRMIQRVWHVDVETRDAHLSCPIPLNASRFVQTFTLGGLIDENGLPATPEMNVRPVTYYLPNEPDAAVSTAASDFFVGGIAPSSECGLCNNNTMDSVFYNHTHDFACDDHGNNTASIRILNNIGIEITKTITAMVIDDKPPNVADSMVEILEDGSVQGDVSNNTWDNCRIQSYELFGGPAWGKLGDSLNLPGYEYFPDSNYFGPDWFPWMATDWQGNPSKVASVGFDVVPVNDRPYVYNTSDSIVPFTISASDVDDIGLSLSAKHTKEGGPEEDGLPMGLIFDNGACNKVEKGNAVLPGVFPWPKTAPYAFPGGDQCSWVLSKSGDKVNPGLYNITFLVTDGGGGTEEALAHSISVEIRLTNHVINESERIIPCAVFVTGLAFAALFAMW